ncbi:MAG: VWA domain-containing protein [Gemmataceae bacterium]|nr:VWA domain-containing protein [Gemmataceae bacterium]MCI0742137.1 VWA domain-containing protein [Gemmataceae bacterium]
MVAELALVATIILAAAAERLHALRARRVALLAFGPAGKPRLWARFAPFLRVAGLSALVWGLTTLLLLPSKLHHSVEDVAKGDYRHLLIVLDVSPSMRLSDAGPTGKQSRMKRANDLLTSFFERVPIQSYRISVIAVYTEAKPVVLETTDLEVVRNILGDLPLHHAFTSGSTNIFAGLEEAAKAAHRWKPQSATLAIISDGDSVPATGMPKMPASIKNVLVVGVGDPVTGQYIDGHQSRQDTSTLRQIATRLGGFYHNGNDKHLPTDLLRAIDAQASKSMWTRLTRREYALFACACGSTTLAFLPLVLFLAGTGWRPGVHQRDVLPRNEQGKGE